MIQQRVLILVANIDLSPPKFWDMDVHRFDEGNKTEKKTVSTWCSQNCSKCKSPSFLSSLLEFYRKTTLLRRFLYIHSSFTKPNFDTPLWQIILETWDSTLCSIQAIILSVRQILRLDVELCWCKSKVYSNILRASPHHPNWKQNMLLYGCALYTDLYSKLNLALLWF